MLMMMCAFDAMLAEQVQGLQGKKGLSQVVRLLACTEQVHLHEAHMYILFHCQETMLICTPFTCILLPRWRPLIPRTMHATVQC